MNESQLRNLIGNYQSQIRRMARKEGWSPADIEDISQEVSISLWSYLNSHQGDCPSDGEVAVIIQRRIDDHFRSHYKSPLWKASSDCELASRTMPSQSQSNVNLRMKVDALLSLLKPRAREILVRKYFYQETISEIAVCIGLTCVGVKKSLQRSKDRLKKLAVSH